MINEIVNGTLVLKEAHNFSARGVLISWDNNPVKLKALINDPIFIFDGVICLEELGKDPSISNLLCFEGGAAYRTWHQANEQELYSLMMLQFNDILDQGIPHDAVHSAFMAIKEYKVFRRLGRRLEREILGL